jgi:acyl carrier protein
MNRHQIETIVLAVLAGILKCDVSLDSNRKTVEQWDSLKHIEIIFALEDELGMEFSEEEIAELNCVIRIVERVIANDAA